MQRESDDPRRRRSQKVLVCPDSRSDTCTPDGPTVTRIPRRSRMEVGTAASGLGASVAPTRGAPAALSPRRSQARARNASGLRRRRLERSVRPQRTLGSTARTLRLEAYVAYFAMRDPRVPWVGKLVAACAVGYLLSPVQLIPDWIPVLGFSDNVAVLAGLAFLRRCSAPSVLADCRNRAEIAVQRRGPASTRTVVVVASALVVGLWLLLGLVMTALIAREVRGSR